jgi:hypothetical protein
MYKAKSEFVIPAIAQQSHKALEGYRSVMC